MAREQQERWNHNIHYHRIVLDALPVGARSALDVGAGNGLLSADLSRRVPEVVAIDVDAEVLDAARGEADGVEWIVGDVMTQPLDRTFDVVASIAALHHLPDLPAALRRLAELTSPGGVLAVVGLARSTRVRDRDTHRRPSLGSAEPWFLAMGDSVRRSSRRRKQTNSVTHHCTRADQ